MMLPEKYQGVEAGELKRRISAAKKRLGRELVILGHHYQRDEVIEFADFTGDSYKLSKVASSLAEARYIVFCGVHFMAEAARILAKKDQRVFLPNMSAGCPMAEMAPIDDVEDAWEFLNGKAGLKDIVPITYMNSEAVLKAFVGQNGGAVCTSSNAGRAFEWGFKRGKRIFFFPDEHLGRNTARSLGISHDDIAVWNHSSPSPLNDHAVNPPSPRGREKEGGGTFSNIRLILWNGYCHVHTLFTVEDVKDARAGNPDCKVIVHPECPEEVVVASDAAGSTEGICRYVESIGPGATIVIGTEINLVSRLARRYQDRKVIPLRRSLCPNMFKISLNHLCWTLENLGEVNEVIVPEPTHSNARLALERMLEV